MNNNKKQILLASIALILLLAIATGIWFTLGPKGMGTGNKTLEIIVVQLDGVQRTHTIETDAEYLGTALTDSKIAQGEQGTYGLYIKTVDGITADDSKQQWWCITKGGADVMTGADMTPIADGDTFEITLKEGY